MGKYFQYNEVPQIIKSKKQIKDHSFKTVEGKNIPIAKHWKLMACIYSIEKIHKCHFKEVIYRERKNERLILKWSLVSEEKHNIKLFLIEKQVL